MRYRTATVREFPWACRPTKSHEDAPVARTLSLLLRDSSRRRADIDMSVDAAGKSECATGRLQRGRCRFSSGHAAFGSGFLGIVYVVSTC
jgi:hypothetical protein